MSRLLVAAALAAIAVPAVATDKTDVAGVVTKYFVATDPLAAAAVCAPNAVVIDDFAPHVWNGKTACADWARDFAAYAKKSGLTPGAVTLGKMRHVQVDGDTAYVVTAATFAFEQGGKKQSHSATVTSALRKTKTGWMITGWSWGQD